MKKKVVNLTTQNNIKEQITTTKKNQQLCMANYTVS